MVSTFTVEDPVESLFCGYSPVNHQTKNSKCNRGDYFKLHTSKDSYYANFSKFALHSTANENKPIPSYSYNEWNTNPTTIERQGLQVLKHTLKQCGLPVSGNKRDLITRIQKHYMQIQNVIHIQRCFRGFLVRESEKMRGPGYKTRSICNNETDFQTMELITDLPREVFFSYKDLGGFIYGFNVFSLLTMFKRNRQSSFVNPYNREDIPFPAIQCIFSLYKKILILYPDCHLLLERVEILTPELETAFIGTIPERGLNEALVEYSRIVRRRSTSSELQQSVGIEDRYIVSGTQSDNGDSDSEDVAESNMSYPEISGQNGSIPERGHNEVTSVGIGRFSGEATQELRSENEFCNSLFERIRSLVNGEANPQWFLQLNSNDLYRFYYYYYIWWTHSNDLSEELKNEICSISHPFIVLNEIDEDGTTEYYQSICLSLMESMIYTGVDEYHCKLGAEYVLMILTVVSRPTRRVWPELFERWS